MQARPRAMCLQGLARASGGKREPRGLQSPWPPLLGQRPGQQAGWAGVAPALPPLGPGCCRGGSLLCEAVSGAGGGGGREFLVRIWVIGSDVAGITGRRACWEDGRSTVGGAVGQAGVGGPCPQRLTARQAPAPYPRLPPSWPGRVRAPSHPRASERRRGSAGPSVWWGPGRVRPGCGTGTRGSLLLPGLSFPTGQGSGWPE